MNRLLVLASVLTLVAIGRFTQAQQVSRSPKEVIEEYWALETNGVTLTPEGWKKGSAFFVKPIARPQSYTIIVIDDSSVWPAWVQGDTAQVMIGIDEVGRIDSQLRYVPPNANFSKEGALWKLVRSESHWELGSDGTTVRQVRGTREWRISNDPGPVVFLSLGSAIRYVIEERDKSTDPNRKEHANATLLALRNYQRKYATHQ
jgi:hypothetical protein